MKPENATTTAPTKLYAALAAAQEKCQAVEKDSRNEFHRYSYASAEAIIGESKRALAGTGLSLVPRSSVVNERLVTVETPEQIDQRTGELVKPAGKREAREWTLVRHFTLAHVSGETLDLETPWPIIPEKGRPFDKAVASAATTSLAYLLRDLLLMPRVDESDNMDHGRRDPSPRDEAPESRPRPQIPARREVRPKMRTVSLDELKTEKTAKTPPPEKPTHPVKCAADEPEQNQPSKATPAPTRNVLEEKIGAVIQRLDEIEGLEPVTQKALQSLTKANGDPEKLNALLGWCERKLNEAEAKKNRG